MAGISWKKRFAELFKEVADCEPPEESQLDEVLAKYQDWYYNAADVPQATLHCSACGSADTDHLTQVLATKRCLRSAPESEVKV